MWCAQTVPKCGSFDSVVAGAILPAMQKVRWHRRPAKLCAHTGMVLDVAVMPHLSKFSLRPTGGVLQSAWRSHRAITISGSPTSAHIPSNLARQCLQATDASDRGKGAEAALSAALPELLDAVSLSMPCREMCEVRLSPGACWGLQTLTTREICALCTDVHSACRRHPLHRGRIMCGRQPAADLQGQVCQECHGVEHSGPTLLCFVLCSP
jgi:hypothetical protein